MAEETKKRKYYAADMRKYAARFDDLNDPIEKKKGLEN